MSRQVTLGGIEFAKLVRGEMVHQAGVQVALVNIDFPSMFAAVSEALYDGARPLTAFELREDLEEIRRWVHGINNAPECGELEDGFLAAFAATVCRADATNYPLLRPAILALKAKFPDYQFKGEL